jgi:hypothetical protein
MPPGIATLRNRLIDEDATTDWPGAQRGASPNHAVVREKLDRGSLLRTMGPFIAAVVALALTLTLLWALYQAILDVLAGTHRRILDADEAVRRRWPPAAHRPHS